MLLCRPTALFCLRPSLDLSRGTQASTTSSASSSSDRAEVTEPQYQLLVIEFLTRDVHREEVPCTRVRASFFFFLLPCFPVYSYDCERLFVMRMGHVSSARGCFWLPELHSFLLPFGLARLWVESNDEPVALGLSGLKFSLNAVGILGSDRIYTHALNRNKTIYSYYH